MGSRALSKVSASHRIQALLEEWGELWATPELASRVTVRFSGRLKRSLGRCRPSTGRITLAERLKSEPRSLLHEVLCHEAAHVATYLRFGAAAKPHGPEWQALVQEAGFEPKVRIAEHRLGDTPPTPRQRRSPKAHVHYEHRCPVCGLVRVARRKVPSWGCTACAEVGLSGRLDITRVEESSRQGNPDE